MMHNSNSESSTMTSSSWASITRAVRSEQEGISSVSDPRSGCSLRGQLLQEALLAAGFRNVIHNGVGYITIKTPEKDRLAYWLSDGRLGSFGYSWQWWSEGDFHIAI